MATMTHPKESLSRTEDLQHRQYRERSLDESKLRALFDAAADALMVADHDGKIVLANKQVGKMFGYQPHDLLRHEIEFLLPNRFRQSWVRRRTDLVAQRQRKTAALNAELFGLRKNGQEFPVELSLKPLTTEQGIWIVSAVRDLTEQRNRESAMRGLSKQLLHLQEEERRRIARDLHDGAGQALCSLVMVLNALKSKISADPEAARSVLSECIRIAEESTKEVRTASYLLYPPMLEELGLKSAISSYLEGFSQRSGIRTTCEISAGLRRLSPEMEVALFRVLQESLTNVLRHSGSKIAHVEVAVDRGIFLLRVSDEGRGMRAENLEQFRREIPGKMGVGLRGMRERMRQLGGKIDVTSTPHGTIVIASVPLPSRSRRLPIASSFTR